MSKYPGLNRRDFEKLLSDFSMPGTLVFRNNKWLGINLQNKTFTVHVKHGSHKKYEPSLVEAVAKDLGLSLEQVLEWYMHL